MHLFIATQNHIYIYHVRGDAKHLGQDLSWIKYATKNFGFRFIYFELSRCTKVG